MYFIVLVIVPDPDEEITWTLERRIADMLAPYDESLYFFDTDYDAGWFAGEWDWYLIGGRWTGFFETEHGTGFHGEPGLMTDVCTNPYTADAVRNKNIVGTIKRPCVVLTVDGWCEVSPGWGGENFNSEYFFRKITEAHPNDWFVCVDCHV